MQLPPRQRNTRILLSYLLGAFFISLVGCEELPLKSGEISAREFIIPAGQHYASPKLMETLETNHVAFRATFDESAQYVLSDPSLQSNVNKLMGFSDCNAHHHENSARFGWRWYENRLEIHAYCYIDSIRVHELIATVNPNEENVYEIVREANAYIFFINGEKKTEISRAQSCSEGVSYKLYPYFGGSAPAPHDVHINIKMIE